MSQEKINWALILIGLVVGLWMAKSGLEAVARRNLEDNLSLAVGSPTTIEQIDFGTHRTEVHRLSIQQEQSLEILESIAVRNIVLYYTPPELVNTPIIIDRVLISGLTVYWDGLTGKNIQKLIRSIQNQTTEPTQKERLKGQQEPKMVTVRTITIEDTEIILQVAGFSKAIRVPKLVLDDITGNRQSIAIQILRQIERHLHEQ